MHRVHPTYRQFLDIEAEVSDDSFGTDEEEEQDIDDTFINDDDEDRSDSVHRTLRNHDCEDEDETLGLSYDKLLDKVLGQSRTKPVEYPEYGTRYSSNERREKIADIMRLPGVHDYPIWRVACKIGSEESIVMSLLHTATEIHDLRSAFTPGSLRGCVYLECMMNQQLISLLQRTPGINHTRQGIKRQLIDKEDYTKLLTLPKDRLSVSAGEWIRIQRGLYRGDIGMVFETHNWGINVLLIPRLPYHSSDKQKRKASSVRSPPNLFIPEQYQQMSSATPQRRPDGSYSLGRLELTHGLLLKGYDYHSISPRVFDIPWSQSEMFALSRHPDIDLLQMPRPQEWIFSENDKVVVRSSGKRGRIRKLRSTCVEIEFEDEGNFGVSWYDIRKEILIGDFVCVLSGPHNGYRGWVIELRTDAALVIDKLSQHYSTGNVIQSVVDPIEVHFNCLGVTDTPFQFTPQSAPINLQVEKSVRHPWCNTDILISKFGHPRKGDTGKVLNVLFNPSAQTGLKFEIQMSRYNPHNPYAKVIVDYEDIVEASTLLDLHTFFKTGRRFDNAGVKQQDMNAVFVNSTGGMTPMPSEPSSSSTPAWDPSSRTPLNIDLWQSPARNNLDHVSESLECSNAIINPPLPEHVLVNPLLVNANLKTVVNGGPYKNKKLTAIVSFVDGRLSIRHPRFTTQHYLEPGWVTPIHPSPTHDHGLLVVIEGEHCGKFIRRIHHKVIIASTVMVLAVVERVQGNADIPTGEHLELAPKFLCKIDEPDNERKVNDAVMAPIRTEYRKKL